MNSDIIQQLPYPSIIPGNNDRTRFDTRALRELADSIRKNGLLQPVTVRPLAVDGETTDLFQIVAGERRYRAIGLLGWSEVPAFVADLTDEEAAALMLAENTARQDLDAIDEARAYSARINGFGWTVEECALGAGVSAVRVQFRLKLLKLNPELQALIRTGDLPLGYAQILADTDLDPNRQLNALARLRDNPTPTPSWFRRQCAEFGQAQAQEPLLDDDFSLSAPVGPSAPARRTEPPHPGTTRPDVPAGPPSQVLEAQASFWDHAAEAWNELGKPFKRQECVAAAQALRAALVMFR